MSTADRLTRRGVPVDPSLRTLALGTFVNRMGSGALTTTFALYFTQVVGLDAGHVALALTVAGIAGMVAQVPLGHFGDLRGPREVLRTLLVLAGLTMFGLLLTVDPWVLVIVLSVEYFFDRGAGAVRSGIIAQLEDGARAVRFKAYLRAVTNVAIAAGSLLGGAALIIGQRWAYLTVFGFTAVSYLITGWLMGRLPHIQPAPPDPTPAAAVAVLRDRPFVVVGLLNGVYAIHFAILEIAIPLWVAERTEAPNWVVAAVLLLNTSAVALFQVRLSRGAQDASSSARQMALGATWIAAGLLVLAFSDGPGQVGAVLLLLVGSAIHVVGEMIGSGGQWGVQMGLAPRERQGQYQGFVGTCFSLGLAIAPPLLAWLCLEHGRLGWAIVAALVLAAGLLTIPATGWALRTRSRYGVSTHSG